MPAGSLAAMVASSVTPRASSRFISFTAMSWICVIRSPAGTLVCSRMNSRIASPLSQATPWTSIPALVASKSRSGTEMSPVAAS